MQTLKTGARWMVHADSLRGMCWQAGSGDSERDAGDASIPKLSLV